MTATTPAPWFADTDRDAVYDKRVWFDESGARFGDTPNLVIRIDGGRPADVHLIAAAPTLLAALQEIAECAPYCSEYDAPLGLPDRIRAAVALATGGAA